MPQQDRRQRIGIFGGPFDPIHIGHLLIAERCREVLDLDQVRFIPAARSPHKLDSEASADKHRLEMVQLAIGGNEHFIVDDRELRRGGTSYTVDTLREISEAQPQDELYLLMGADSLASFDTWRQPEQICQLACVVVLARGGQPAPDLKMLARFLPDGQQQELASHLVTMPQVEISSSEIRQRISQRLSVRYTLHPTTKAYIAASGLYK